MRLGQPPVVWLGLPLDHCTGGPPHRQALAGAVGGSAAGKPRSTLGQAPPRTPSPLCHVCRQLVYAHSLRPSLEPAFRALTRHLLAPKWEAQLAARQAAEEEARRQAALQALLQEEEEGGGGDAAAQVGRTSPSGDSFCVLLK